MKTIHVDLGDRSYPIYLGAGLLKQEALFTAHIRSKQVMVVTNETVAPLYLDKVRSLLTDYSVSEVILPDGEKFKNLETVNQIFTELLERQHSRTTTLIALGGGVIGDMTGFAAACYQRGVNFIQVPTTLLSQVDSSVGGKTGVNHALGKNMIGAFYQPKAVIIDTETLQTLPTKELSAGIAEVVKYGLIAEPSFYRWLQEHMADLMGLDQGAICHAIETSCVCKAKVVSLDEKESGIRAILNLGHTFGHAIETHTGYGSWLHGEAVSVGMVMAARLSQLMGAIGEEDVEGLIRLLTSAALPVVGPADMNFDDYCALMAVDKKVLDGTLRLVLLRAMGEAYVTSDFSEENLRLAIESATRS